jgi:hypothetical protein
MLLLTDKRSLEANARSWVRAHVSVRQTSRAWVVGFVPNYLSINIRIVRWGRLVRALTLRGRRGLDRRHRRFNSTYSSNCFIAITHIYSIIFVIFISLLISSFLSFRNHIITSTSYTCFVNITHDTLHIQYDVCTIFTGMETSMLVYCVVMSCGLVNAYQHSAGTDCLYLLGVDKHSMSFQNLGMYL